MKTAIIINLATYQKTHQTEQTSNSVAPISSELVIAIQQLILRLKESDPRRSS